MLNEIRQNIFLRCAGVYKIFKVVLFYFIKWKISSFQVHILYLPLKTQALPQSVLATSFDQVYLKLKSIYLSVIPQKVK